jgi:small subunit ribosomal protein S15
MARMHSRAKGKAGSTKPVVLKKHVWLKYSKDEVEKLILKLNKSGKSKSEIGLILRDSYGIPDVRLLVDKKIGAVLDENKQTKQIPEDVIALIKREINLSKHLEKNHHDMSALRGIQLTESKINRLVKYYKTVGKLPKDWKYSREESKLLIG